MGVVVVRVVVVVVVARARARLVHRHDGDFVVGEPCLAHANAFTFFILR